MTADLEQVLTDDEGAALDAAELVIGRGIKAFVAVGNALAEIRARRLYRTTFATFEDYCQQRWGFGRNRANRLIVAAEITESIAAVVPTGTIPIPGSERQARELAPLRSEAAVMQQAWTEAVQQSPTGQPTATEVRDVVGRLNEISDNVDTTTAPRRDRADRLRPSTRRPLPLQLWTAVHELRKAAEKVEKLVHDDRFPAHAAQFFSAHDGDLSVVAGVVGELGAARRRAAAS